VNQRNGLATGTTSQTEGQIERHVRHTGRKNQEVLRLTEGYVARTSV
jgi:hypothetical protein